MATYLDDIVARHRAKASSDHRTPGQFEASLVGLGQTRDFAAALAKGSARDGDVAVIAEIKRRSPSKGELFADLDPAKLAHSYAGAGAACLSVLTDEEHFGGSVSDLQAARQACELPVLRKDFTVSEGDVIDARVMGADAILLIAAALDDHELATFLILGESLGMGVLVEVHDTEELERALATGASIIGVNQRDLHTFEVDRAKAVELASSIPDSCIRVAESGISSRDEVRLLVEAGYHAILVGEALITAPDPGVALRELVS